MHRVLQSSLHKETFNDYDFSSNTMDIVSSTSDI